MHTVYLLLGSNKGDRLKYLLLAKYYLKIEVGELLKTSAVYSTAPWGNIKQPTYLNQAILLKTEKTPFQLLRILQKIEKKLKRTNKHNYASRTIDIDILFYDSIILNAKNLQIPHPRLQLRNFTLLPLLELNQSYTHPVLQKSIEVLAKECNDTLKVSIFNANRNGKHKP